MLLLVRPNTPRIIHLFLLFCSTFIMFLDILDALDFLCYIGTLDPFYAYFFINL